MGSTYVPSYFETIEYALKRVESWHLEFAFMPHRCIRSRSLIWLKYAYKGIRIITGPGTPVVETFWMTKEDFIIWQLKGN
jgi:hypothetical protein